MTAQVQEILTEGEGESQRAVAVRLADGRTFRGKSIVSNATRWDTFEKLMAQEKLPPSEEAFRDRYKKSPSFLSIHMGVKASALPQGEHASIHLSAQQNTRSLLKVFMRRLWLVPWPAQCKPYPKNSKRVTLRL